MEISSANREATGLHWTVVVGACLAIYYIAAAIYNLYFSPLAKYPGPFFAKISAWPSFWHTFNGNRQIWLWQCGQIYGPSFRYRPDGAIINTPSGHRSIYDIRANVKKGKFYEVWPRNQDDRNTLNSTDKAIHARKRRVISAAFTDKALESAESFVIQHVNRWCELLIDGDGKEWSEPKNVARWTEYLAFDIMGDLVFGKSFDIKEPGENPFRFLPQFIYTYMSTMYSVANSPFVRSWVWLKPRGLDLFSSLLVPKDVQKYYDFVQNTINERVRLENELQKQGGEDSTSRKDIFHYLLNTTDPDTGKRAYKPDELFSEANLLIIAGSDTTSSTLAAVIFYLTRYPLCYAKVVQEVRSTRGANVHVSVFQC